MERDDLPIVKVRLYATGGSSYQWQGVLLSRFWPPNTLLTQKCYDHIMSAQLASSAVQYTGNTVYRDKLS